jgi:hypothetical protein
MLMKQEDIKKEYAGIILLKIQGAVKNGPEDY